MKLFTLVIEAFVDAAGGNRELLLTDMTSDTVELLLDWIYDSLEGCLNFTQAVDMCKAGHKLDIAVLWQHCERILKAYVSHETCLQVANVAMDCHSSLLTEVSYSPHANILCLWSWTVEPANAV